MSVRIRSAAISFDWHMSKFLKFWNAVITKFLPRTQMYACRTPQNPAPNRCMTESPVMKKNHATSHNIKAGHREPHFRISSSEGWFTRKIRIVKHSHIWSSTSTILKRPNTVRIKFGAITLSKSATGLFKKAPEEKVRFSWIHPVADRSLRSIVGRDSWGIFRLLSRNALDHFGRGRCCRANGYDRHSYSSVPGNKPYWTKGSLGGTCAYEV